MSKYLTVFFLLLALSFTVSSLRLEKEQHAGLFGDIGAFFGGIFGGGNQGN